MTGARLLLPYNSDLFSELNVEKYELLKTGKTHFPPNGTHDDMLWALALAVYASRPEIPSYKPAKAFGHVINRHPWLAPRIWVLRPGTYSVTSIVRCLTCWSAKRPRRKMPPEDTKDRAMGLRG